MKWEWLVYPLVVIIMFGIAKKVSPRRWDILYFFSLSVVCALSVVYYVFNWKWENLGYFIACLCVGISCFAGALFADDEESKEKSDKKEGEDKKPENEELEKLKEKLRELEEQLKVKKDI
ncbi:hypothetical protein [Victivallis lenta]|uniref:hypothetical protein n=1 Tax=Victivallis lenta TaxID=2606640 RepID=UPI0015AE647B|nr:hypothetical protein [Victivallis lenta]DAG92393.1 MAG TPA: zipper dimerization domain transcription factor-like protein [Herelleviridae sp.]